ncbi:hypothetical protein GLOIN_2v1873867 [Rhizophagus irregularis DAOM 181602=DAOM 197198]|nr:hypothetical protein GLOIN_2v1873867 [Rhizophagus irregularis DAOM 181602=DAOM 197198]
MSLPYLIDDCVYDILQYLQNDGTTLFNCLLVNRFWCLSIFTDKMYEDIIPIFHQSILRQSRNIKQLDISLHLFYKQGFKNFNVQNFISNLTKLKSLSLSLDDIINNEIKQEFLGNITNNSLNLSKLIIKLTQTRGWNDDVTSLMIKYLGESLQRLLIENPTIQLIENISMIKDKGVEIMEFNSIHDVHKMYNISI